MQEAPKQMKQNWRAYTSIHLHQELHLTYLPLIFMRISTDRTGVLVSLGLEGAGEERRYLGHGRSSVVLVFGDVLTIRRF